MYVLRPLRLIASKNACSPGRTANSTVFHTSVFDTLRV